MADLGGEAKEVVEDVERGTGVEPDDAVDDQVDREVADHRLRGPRRI